MNEQTKQQQQQKFQQIGQNIREINVMYDGKDTR